MGEVGSVQAKPFSEGAEAVAIFFIYLNLLIEL
jgi:hypothetical protein